MEPELPDGLVAVVKRACPTCEAVVPVLAELAAVGLTVVTRDDPAFPPGFDPIDDTDLRLSDALDLDTVPTLLRFEGGRQMGRTAGWKRSAWEELSGVRGLGDGLPPQRPGCGCARSTPGWPISCWCGGGAPTCAAGHWRSEGSRTSSRPCSTAGGATACRWCRRPRYGYC